MASPLPLGSAGLGPWGRTRAPIVIAVAVLVVAAVLLLPALIPFGRGHTARPILPMTPPTSVPVRTVAAVPS